MVKSKQSSTKKRASNGARSCRSAKIAEKGIKTGREFAELMSALMSDLITGAITPGVGNATCNAGGKLLKMVEMQIKYGGPSANLQLAGPAPQAANTPT